ncbi:hypothetical protein ABK040_007669 [Willaertia magna]
MSATKQATPPSSSQYEMQQISTLKRESTFAPSNGHNSIGMTSTTHGKNISTASVDRNRCCFCSLRVSTIAILLTMFSAMFIIFMAIIAAILLTSFRDLERAEANATSKRFLKAVGDQLFSFYQLSVSYSSYTYLDNSLRNYGTTFTDEQMDGFMEDLLEDFFDTSLLFDLSKTVQACVSTHIWSDTTDAVSNEFRESLKDYRSKIVIPEVDIKSNWFDSDVFASGLLPQVELEDRVCWSKTGVTNITSSNRFAAYELIGDINGEPLFISRVDQSREINAVGLQTSLLAIFLLLGACILASAIIIVFIERRILYRVSSLTRRIQDITGTNDAKQRIDLFRKDDDEIGLMVRNINGLLTSLDNLLEEAKEQEVVKKLFQRIATVEETTKNIMNAIKDIVITIGVDGNVLYANTSFYEQFGYSQRDLGNTEENLKLNGNNCLTIGTIFPDILNNLQNTGSTSSLSSLSGSNNNTGSNYQFSNNNNITTAPSTRHDINSGNIYTYILKEFREGHSHLMKGVTKNHKDTIDFECIITKTYIVLNGIETVAYVLVGRKMSNRLSSSSLSNTVTDEEEEMLGEFDKMLLDENERLRFKEFCKNEKSEENILFIESVLEYKALKKPHERMMKQEYILNTFLANATLLNLSDEMFTREVPLIRRGIGQVDLFDNLLIYVETIVCKDTYMRFKQQQTHLMYL